MSETTREKRKAPGAEVDFGFNWDDEGANDGGDTDTGYLQGATLAASVWEITGPDEALTKVTSSFDDTTTAIIVSGGTLNRRYTLKNTVTLSGSGFIDARVMYINVEEL